MLNTLTKDVEGLAKSALTGSQIYALRNLKVKRDGASLFISGRVTTYYHKQLAQEVVRAVAEDLQVVNFVSVEDDARNP